MRRLLVIAILVTPALRAQSAEAVLLQALVNEIRALRITMERTSTIAPRIQLTLQRVQIQEQKVSRLSDRLGVARQQAAQFATQQARIAEEVRKAEERVSATDANQRKQAEDMRDNMKAELQRTTRTAQQFEQQEAELAGALRMEQARLDELTQRLTELERGLDPKQ